MERDEPVTLLRRIEKIISTHTLTWSVTSPAEKGIVSNCISTHTLTWSVTEPVS